MNKAFTLVESLVIIFIIAVLSLIILPDYGSISEQLVLQRSSSKLAQDIRRVQEMAMSAEEFEGSTPSGGFGINIRETDGDHYYLYADVNDSGTFNSGEELEPPVYFEQGIEIKNLSRNNLNITFKPPDPIIYISNNDDLAIIEICLRSDPSKTKSVLVNKAGLINIQ